MTTPANEWREIVDEFERLFLRGKHEGLAWEVARLGVLDLLTTHSAHRVEKIEGLKEQIQKKEGDDIEQWSETGKVAYYYIDQAIDIIKDNK